MRKMFLNGTLNADLMGMEEYERMFDYESDNFNEYTMNGDILVFCSNGLNQYEKYNKFDHIKPDLDKIFARFEREQRAQHRAKFRKSKRFALIAAVVIGSMLIATVTAAAMGYNFIDLIRRAVNAPDRSATHGNDNQMNFSDLRFYGSVAELFEVEDISFLYPVGYEFSNIEVDDFDGDLIVRMSCSDPYISFGVRLGVNVQLDSYSYEMNGIKYRVLEMGGGLYQADFSYNDDYYTIEVGNRDIISEIIENLWEC
jgi:hypothetical protein